MLPHRETKIRKGELQRASWFRRGFRGLVSSVDWLLMPRGVASRPQSKHHGLLPHRETKIRKGEPQSRCSHDEQKLVQAPALTITRVARGLAVQMIPNFDLHSHRHYILFNHSYYSNHHHIDHSMCQWECSQLDFDCCERTARGEPARKNFL